jgi:molybdopterin/thiamine biosynthesis adenylyltransferase
VALESSPEWADFANYDVVILTEATNAEIVAVNAFCRKHGKKLIGADSYGAFTRVFNDFGASFEVLDKDGEELHDVMIKAIDQESGVVELLPHTKHKFQDGDEVLITKVDGMRLLEGKANQEGVKSDSINETIRKVTALTPYSFKIDGDLSIYEKYERNGIAR